MRAPPAIDRDQALEIARRRAAQNGWGMVEPACAQLRRPWFGSGGTWEVESDPLMRGTKCRFEIDATTGEILHQGYLPH